jgi:hypothetical protein
MQANIFLRICTYGFQTQGAACRKNPEIGGFSAMKVTLVIPDRDLRRGWS